MKVKSIQIAYGSWDRFYKLGVFLVVTSTSMNIKPLFLQFNFNLSNIEQGLFSTYYVISIPSFADGVYHHK